MIKTLVMPRICLTVFDSKKFTRSPQFLTLCSCVSGHIEILQLYFSKVSDDDILIGEINAVGSAFISLDQESKCIYRLGYMYILYTCTVCQNQIIAIV